MAAAHDHQEGVGLLARAASVRSADQGSVLGGHGQQVNALLWRAVSVSRTFSAHRRNPHRSGARAHGGSALARDHGHAPGLARHRSCGRARVAVACGLRGRADHPGRHQRKRHSDHRFRRDPDSLHAARFRRHGNHPVRHAGRLPGHARAGHHHRLLVCGLYRRRRGLRHPGRPGRAAAPGPGLPASGCGRHLPGLQLLPGLLRRGGHAHRPGPGLPGGACGHRRRLRSGRRELHGHGVLQHAHRPVGDPDAPADDLHPAGLHARLHLPRLRPQPFLEGRLRGLEVLHVRGSGLHHPLPGLRLAGRPRVPVPDRRPGGPWHRGLGRQEGHRPAQRRRLHLWLPEELGSRVDRFRHGGGRGLQVRGAHEPVPRLAALRADRPVPGPDPHR